MLQIEIISDFDEDELVEKVNYFLENNVKIKDILAKLVINTNKIEDNTEKLNINANNIKNINGSYCKIGNYNNCDECYFFKFNYCSKDRSSITYKIKTVIKYFDPLYIINKDTIRNLKKLKNMFNL